MGYSRQGYWNGFPFPSPEDLPNPGIKPGSPTSQADTLPFKPPRNGDRKQNIKKTQNGRAYLQIKRSTRDGSRKYTTAHATQYHINEQANPKKKKK